MSSSWAAFQCIETIIQMILVYVTHHRSRSVVSVAQRPAQGHQSAFHAILQPSLLKPLETTKMKTPLLTLQSHNQNCTLPLLVLEVQIRLLPHLNHMGIKKCSRQFTTSRLHHRSYRLDLTLALVTFLCRLTPTNAVQRYLLAFAETFARILPISSATISVQIPMYPPTSDSFIRPEEKPQHRSRLNVVSLPLLNSTDTPSATASVELEACPVAPSTQIYA